MKKVLSVLLVLAMLLTLLPLSAMALPATYVPLVYNEGTLVTLEVGEYKLCRFVPTVSQAYQIYSYDSDGLDPVAVLYDSSMVQLASNDDYNHRDFRIAYEMTAGETYYLGVNDYDKNDAGSMMIMVTDILPLALDLEESELDVFSGTQYTLGATVSPDDATSALTWSSSDETIATVDAGGVITFLQSGVVTITAETVNGLTDSCDFTVTQVTGALVLDEVKTITVTEGSATSQCLVFTPAETGYYHIRSFAIVSDLDDPEIDPKITVYDREYRQVGYSDDSDDRNFCAELELEAGQSYFCHIGIYDEDARGTYQVVAERIEAASAIRIDCDDIVTRQGEYLELPISFAPEGCWRESYAFTSSDESVIAVDGYRLYAVGSGEAVVTVTSAQSGLTDTITVTVVGVTELELDTTYTAQLFAEGGADHVRYVFKPTVSGLYTIASDEAVGENVSATVELRDKREALRYNHTGGKSFSLTYELTAGEMYYYDVYLDNPNVDRSIRFVLTKEDEAAMPQAFVNTDHLVEIDNPGDGVFYMFKPTMTGEYSVFSMSEDDDGDPKLFVYNDEWRFVDSDDDGAGDDYNNYWLTYEFEAGKTYYLKNIIYYADKVGSYTMRIEPEFELTETATVSGTVSGIKGDTPIVIHFIAEGSAEPAYEVILEGNGDYEIEYVPLGTYTVRLTATGYEPFEMTVVIEGNTIVNFEAAPSKPTHIVWFYLSDTATEATYGVEIEEGGLVQEPEAPGADGKTFLGWYVDGVTPYDFLTPVTEELKLVAMWKEELIFVTQPTSTVTGMGNGYRFNFSTSLPITQATLEIKNPTSSVWFTDNNAQMSLSSGVLFYPSAALCQNNKSVYRIKVTDGTQTVYSDSFTITWAIGYTVTFRAGGGTGTMDPISDVYGTYLLPECSFTAPAGKQFKAWKVGNLLTLLPGQPISVTADVTLTAIWEDIPDEVMTGDIDGNSIVNMMDVMALYNGVSGKVTLTEAQNAAGDVDANGIANMMDMMALYNQVSGKV